MMALAGGEEGINGAFTMLLRSGEAMVSLEIEGGAVFKWRWLGGPYMSIINN
jgi:hypothetical protein